MGESTGTKAWEHATLRQGAQGTELRAQGKTQPSTQHPVTYINHRN